MQSYLRAALIALLAVGLLALFFRHADLRRVWMEISRARPGLLVAALGATVLTYLIRALRWQYLLRPIGPTRFATALRMTVIGFAATALLPARVGEFLRPYLLARREGFSVASTMATIVLERLLDTIAVLMMFGAFLLVFDPGMARADARTFRALRIGGLATAGVAAVALVIVFVLAARPKALAAIVLRVTRVQPGRLAPAAGRGLRLFAEGLAVVRQPARLATAVFLSFPLWFSIAAGVWWAALAFRIDLPFTGSFLMLALLVVGVAVPTPGAIGGFHEAFRLGATAFYGSPNDRAVGAAIVLHAISFVPVALVGSFFMAQEGLSLTRVRRLAAEAGGEETASEVPLLRASRR